MLFLHILWTVLDDINVSLCFASYEPSSSDVTDRTCLRAGQRRRSGRGEAEDDASLNWFLVCRASLISEVQEP